MTVQELVHQLQLLDVNNPGAWPQWARVAAAALLAVVLFGVAVYVLVRPQYESLKTLEAEEQTLRSTFETNQRKAAALEAYKEQLAEMERNFGSMLKQLPSRSEVANLLNDISQTRVAASLEEELFRPQPEVPKEFYAEIPNNIVVLGSFHELGHFASAVAALPRIVTIDDVEISVAGGTRAPGDDKAVLLRMKAVAKTYRYLDESDASPAGTKK